MSARRVIPHRLDGVVVDVHAERCARVKRLHVELCMCTYTCSGYLRLWLGVSEIRTITTKGALVLPLLQCRQSQQDHVACVLSCSLVDRLSQRRRPGSVLDFGDHTPKERKVAQPDRQQPIINDTSLIFAESNAAAHLLRLLCDVDVSSGAAHEHLRFVINHRRNAAVTNRFGHNALSIRHARQAQLGCHILHRTATLVLQAKLLTMHRTASRVVAVTMVLAASSHNGQHGVVLPEAAQKRHHSGADEARTQSRCNAADSTHTIEESIPTTIGCDSR